jgi:hypothetical protein
MFSRFAKALLVATALAPLLVGLASYLLPFLTKDQMDFEKNPIATAYFLVIMFFAVSVTNAYDFNPLLMLLGYHFYEVENHNGMAFLVVSRRIMRRPTDTLEVVQLTDYMFLDVGIGPLTNVSVLRHPW